MKGFIVYATYDVIDDKTQIQLYGRLENGQSFALIKTLEPYFFVEDSKTSKLKQYFSKYKTEKTKLTNFAGDPVTKVSHTSQTEINKLVPIVHEKEIDTYEADVKPAQRFIIDNNILGSIDLQGDYQSTERVNRVYTEPDISAVEFTPKLETLAIDLESDKHSDKLYCIGLYGSKGKTVLMVTDKKTQIPGVIPCKSEAECLEKFKAKILELDPDIITGWNITDFDFPYLRKLFDKHKIPFDIGRSNESVRMKISSDFFKNSTVNIPGRQVLDGLNLIKDPFIQEAPSIKNIEIDSWTLEDAAQAILSEGKLLTGKDRHLEIDSWYKTHSPQGLQKLAEYNLQDCKLAYDILQKTKTIELAIERCQLTGLTLDRLTASIAAFDSLYIREARSRGLVSPTTRFSHKEERIKGGYVMDSTPGVYENVLVLDFKSLYPSLIRTLNIDPASHLQKKQKGAVETPNGVFFKNTEGILPHVIETLHKAREKAKKEKRELASYAIKIIMNSFFGVLANPNCRYFSLDVANAITHSAQFTIKLTAQKVEESGLRVIYSDTDSVFIDTQEKSYEKANKLGQDIAAKINTFYKKFIKEKYARESFLEIEFKRHYTAFMIAPVRGKNTEDAETSKGSKKRYAGLIKVNGKEELEIVGLEAIRGDWTEAAKDFQKELLLNIFHKKEFVKFIKDYVAKIKSGKLDDKLVYRKSLRKNLDEYVKTTPPHVKAARKLPQLTSTTVEYLITADGPEPIQNIKHAIDYEHYIDKQIAPIADTFLFFFKKTFEEIMKESKQTKLFS